MLAVKILFAALVLVMAGAVFGADTAFAQGIRDDGSEAPFPLGTNVYNVLDRSGVVVATIRGKSYVWNDNTGRCWAYQREPVDDAGFSTTAIVALENLTGVCDRYKPRPEPPPPPSTMICSREQVSTGYTYRMPVIESGGFAFGAVPATTKSRCTTSDMPNIGQYNPNIN